MDAVTMKDVERKLAMKFEERNLIPVNKPARRKKTPVPYHAIGQLAIVSHQRPARVGASTTTS